MKFLLYTNVLLFSYSGISERLWCRRNNPTMTMDHYDHEPKFWTEVIDVSSCIHKASHGCLLKNTRDAIYDHVGIVRVVCTISLCRLLKTFVLRWISSSWTNFPCSEYFLSYSMCAPPVPTDVSSMTVTPALQQHAIQTIQCKLILLRISEVRHKNTDPVLTSVIQYLHNTINELNFASKQTRSKSSNHCLQANDRGITACLTTINAKLRKLKRFALLTLVFTILSHNEDPLPERAALKQRVATFLAGRCCPSNPSVGGVVRHEAAHFLVAFDQAVANLYWHQRPPYLENIPLFIRVSFLTSLLPRFQVVFPLARDMQDCPICCEAFQYGCVATRFTACCHAFHAACLDK